MRSRIASAPSTGRDSSPPASSPRLDCRCPAMDFFQTFWTWLNGELSSYIGENTSRVASILEPAVVTLGTVYVMIWGYLQLTGRIEEPFVAGLKRIVTLAVIFGVALHLWLYNTLDRKSVV